MSKQEAIKRRNQARRLRERLDDEIAENLFALDRVEDQIAIARDRRDVADSERERETIKARIASKLATRKELKAEIHELRPRREKAARAAKKWARKARNYISPKVYDMGFDRGAVRPLSSAAPTSLFVGHYTAGPLADDEDEAKELWKRYDAYHKDLGWACLGYNLGIDPDGGIALLRGLEWTGAHTINYNTGHPGISAHGTTGDRLNRNQRRALRVIQKKWGAGKPCIGHREAPGQSTACPGDMLSQYKSWGKEA